MTTLNITIPVVVVESHQHVLEHVHHVLRRRQRQRPVRQQRRHKRLHKRTKTHAASSDSNNDAHADVPPSSSSSLLMDRRGWSMVHFDSHPDLATSRSIPARLYFTPRQPVNREQTRTTCCYCNNNDDGDNIGGSDNKNNNDDYGGGKGDSYNPNHETLYDMLDMTSTGISEWILPLVLAANLRHIEWIKQSFSTQLPIGTHRYNVGVDVNIHCCCNKSRTKKLNETITCFVDLDPGHRLKVDWYNPYYLDDDSYVPTDQLVLKQPLRLDVKELPAVTQLDDDKKQHDGDNDKHGDDIPTAGWMLDICLDYFVCCNPYLQELDDCCPNVTTAFLQVMNESSFGTINSAISDPTDSNYATDIVTFRTFLQRRLESDEQVESRDHKNDDDLRNYVRFFPGKTIDEVKTLLDNLIQCINGDLKILRMVIETIPNWNMPHDTSILHSSTDGHLSELLQQVEQELSMKKVVYSNTPPFMITIARSSFDGFTPATVVEKLQSDVLSVIERVFCNDDLSSKSHSYRLEVVRDYGEWEGSTIPDDILR